jgi:hypothetical protein
LESEFGSQFASASYSTSATARAFGLAFDSASALVKRSASGLPKLFAMGFALASARAFAFASKSMIESETGSAFR